MNNLPVTIALLISGYYSIVIVVQLVLKLVFDTKWIIMIDSALVPIGDFIIRISDWLQTKFK